MKENPPNREIDQLAKLINLPQRPQQVLWQSVEQGDDWTLIAVLRFSSPEVQALLSGEPKFEGEMPLISKSQVFDWFPSGLRSMLVPADVNTYEVKGNLHTPERFFRSPLVHGYMMRIQSTDDIFLYLCTM